MQNNVMRQPIEFGGSAAIPTARKGVVKPFNEIGKFGGALDYPDGSPEMKNPQVNELLGDSNVGGADGTRTRVPRRDRPVF